MKIQIGHADGIELNLAPEEQLDQEVGLGPERARRIIEHRPFRSWDDVQRLEGFTALIVDDLRAAGAQLGDPARAERNPISEEHHRQLELREHAGAAVDDEGVAADGRRGPDRRAS
jgi:hypothetical protein